MPSHKLVKSCTNGPSTWCDVFPALCSMMARTVWCSPFWLHLIVMEIILTCSCFTLWCRTAFVFALKTRSAAVELCDLTRLHVSTVTEEFMLPTPTTTHLLQQPHTALVPWWAHFFRSSLPDRFPFLITAFFFSSVLSCALLFFPPFPLHGFERWWHLLT